jgi:hypothetical protein
VTTKQQARGMGRSSGARWCLLVACAALACFAAGCASMTENALVSVSDRDCVQGWNRGTLYWTEAGFKTAAPDTSPSTRSLGQIGVTVAVSDGRDDCTIIFGDASHRPIARFSACCFRETSDASRGTAFTYHFPNALYSSSPGGEPMGKGPGYTLEWNGCQDAAGTIRLSSSCPPTPARLHDLEPFLRHARVGWIREALGDHRSWWLGFRFHGATADYSNLAIIYEYNAPDSGQSWQLKVRSDRPPIITESPGVAGEHEAGINVRVAPDRVTRIYSMLQPGQHLPAGLLRDAAARVQRFPD